MGALGSLRDDHTVISKKLKLVESALEVGPEGRLVLRELCFSLLRLLKAHMQREAEPLRIYRERIPSGRYLVDASGHAIEAGLLRAVNELLLSGMRASMPMIVLRLTQAIERLQEQMQGQEQTVFLALEEGGASVGADPSAAISETMSVNEILRRYPQTEPVFDRLRVDRLREGYESVDELAWGHGMDVSQVIEQLRQAVGFPGFEARSPARVQPAA